MVWRFGLAGLSVLILSAQVAQAEPRFRIDGSVLVYDTANPVDATVITDGTPPEDTVGEIAYEDVGVLRSILQRNGERIETLPDRAEHVVHREEA